MTVRRWVLWETAVVVVVPAVVFAVSGWDRADEAASVVSALRAVGYPSIISCTCRSPLPALVKDLPSLQHIAYIMTGVNARARSPAPNNPLA